MKHFLILLLISYVILLMLMYFFQRKLLYFPSVEPTETAFQVLTLDSDELQIKVLVDHPQREQAVIYFGGNGENVYESAKLMQQAFTDVAAYYVNYPGYGGSSGSPSESAIIQAAQQVYAYVNARHQSVALLGRSLGTGVAVNLASEYPVAKLILITPFDSIAALAFTHYPFLPTQWLIKDTFDSASRAPNVNAKVLIILAAEDKVIPLKHSQTFIAALKNDQSESQFKQRATVQVYQHADHNNVHLHPDFMQQIRGFLQD